MSLSKHSASPALSIRRRFELNRNMDITNHVHRIRYLRLEWNLARPCPFRTRRRRLGLSRSLNLRRRFWFWFWFWTRTLCSSAALIWPRGFRGGSGGVCVRLKEERGVMLPFLCGKGWRWRSDFGKCSANYCTHFFHTFSFFYSYYSIQYGYTVQYREREWRRKANSVFLKPCLALLLLSSLWSLLC